MSRRLLAIAVALAFTGAACTSGSDDPQPDGDGEASTQFEEAATADCPDDVVEVVDAWGDAGFNGVVTILRGPESCVATAGVRDRATGEPMTGDRDECSPSVR